MRRRRSEKPARIDHSRRYWVMHALFEKNGRRLGNFVMATFDEIESARRSCRQRRAREKKAGTTVKTYIHDSHEKKVVE